VDGEFAKPMTAQAFESKSFKAKRRAKFRKGVFAKLRFVVDYLPSRVFFRTRGDLL
jgi:hypothetical protein